jgi:putative transposase
MRREVLNDEQTLETVLESLLEHIQIDTQGDCDEETLFTVLLRAASTCDTIEHTADTLENVPDGGTIRYHVNKCRNMADMEEAVNTALQSRVPENLTTSAQRLAIDLNLQPYYGTPTETEAPYIYRSKAHAGTCSFYAYATCYVIRKGKRVTIALTPVRRDDLMVGIVTRLLDRAVQFGIRLKRLYLDRGFFSVPVIRWLQALGVPVVMPVIIRGTTGGTRQLLQGGKSYKTLYTMKSNDYGTVTFDVWVVCVYQNGKRGKHGRRYYAYVAHQVRFGLRALHRDYRLRFGIESTYRLKNTCRIKTAMKNPVARFLFAGIAFLLIDVWIFLLWTVVSRPRRGGRQVYRSLFPLQRLLDFLRQAIERRYTVKTAIYL